MGNEAYEARHAVVGHRDAQFQRLITKGDFAFRWRGWQKHDFLLAGAGNIAPTNP
jgi:hypothetical protein